MNINAIKVILETEGWEEIQSLLAEEMNKLRLPETVSKKRDYKSKES